MLGDHTNCVSLMHWSHSVLNNIHISQIIVLDNLKQCFCGYQQRMHSIQSIWHNLMMQQGSNRPTEPTEPADLYLTLLFLFTICFFASSPFERHFSINFNVLISVTDPTFITIHQSVKLEQRKQRFLYKCKFRISSNHTLFIKLPK